MNNQNLGDLYQQFSAIAESGDEKTAREFLKAHLKEFPEDVQRKIVFEFFADALGKDAKSAEQKAEIQKVGMEAIADIDKTKTEFTEKQKLQDLRSNLGIGA